MENDELKKEVIGFTLSTVSLKFVRRVWEKKRRK
jgi:hypothetical protein